MMDTHDDNNTTMIITNPTMASFTASEGRSILENLVDHLVEKLGSKYVNNKDGQPLAIQEKDFTAEFLNALHDEAMRRSMVQLLSGDMDKYIERKYSIWSFAFQKYIFPALRQIVQNPPQEMLNIPRDQKYINRFVTNESLVDDYIKQSKKKNPNLIGGEPSPEFTLEEIDNIKALRKEFYKKVTEMCKARGLRLFKINPRNYEHFTYYATKFAPSHPKHVLAINVDWWKKPHKTWIVMHFNVNALRHDYSMLSTQFYCLHQDSYCFGNLTLQNGMRACVNTFRSMILSANKVPGKCPLCLDPMYSRSMCPRCGYEMCEVCIFAMANENHRGGVTKCPHCRYDFMKAEVHGSMSTEKLVKQKAMMELAKRLEEEGVDTLALWKKIYEQLSNNT